MYPATAPSLSYLSVTHSSPPAQLLQPLNLAPGQRRPDPEVYRRRDINTRTPPEKQTYRRHHHRPPFNHNLRLHPPHLPRRSLHRRSRFRLHPRRARRPAPRRRRRGRRSHHHHQPPPARRHRTRCPARRARPRPSPPAENNKQHAHRGPNLPHLRSTRAG